MNVHVLNQHLTGSQFEQVDRFNQEASELEIISAGGFLVVLARGAGAKRFIDCYNAGLAALADAPQAPDDSEPEAEPYVQKRKPGWPGGAPAKPIVLSGPISAE